MSAAKSTGLAQFSGKTAAKAEPTVKQAAIRRGAGDEKGLVAITVRLTKADWIRLKNFAMDSGDTLQTIAIRGFNRELANKGQAPLGV